MIEVPAQWDGKDLIMRHVARNLAKRILTTTKPDHEDCAAQVEVGDALLAFSNGDADE